MPKPLRAGIVGLGRMGAVHALHIRELAHETGHCTLSAMADVYPDRARSVASTIGSDAPIFNSVEELAKARVCDAVVVVTPTEQHQEHASLLVEQGYRVLLEKPLTGDLYSDRSFAADLDAHYRDSLMLAFQRRFDVPLRYAKGLIESGAIGRVFKIYSSLEDSNPAPDGYQSSGILPDMSVHNVDEILWLTGATPRSSLAIGSRLSSYQRTTCQEDFDDALLYVWFENDMLAQIQVSRNHVSGYRVETIVFGEEGQIHIGRFEQNPLDVIVETYGKRGRSEPVARQVFSMRRYEGVQPEFVDRFGPAYKAELQTFIECCQSGASFPTSHRDGLRAQEVISAGMDALFTVENARQVVFA